MAKYIHDSLAAIFKKIGSRENSKEVRQAYHKNNILFMIEYSWVVVESSCGFYLIFEEITRIITIVIYWDIRIL